MSHNRNNYFNSQHFKGLQEKIANQACDSYLQKAMPDYKRPRSHHNNDIMVNGKLPCFGDFQCLDNGIGKFNFEHEKNAVLSTTKFSIEPHSHRSLAESISSSVVDQYTTLLPVSIGMVSAPAGICGFLSSPIQVGYTVALNNDPLVLSRPEYKLTSSGIYLGNKSTETGAFRFLKNDDTLVSNQKSLPEMSVNKLASSHSGASANFINTSSCRSSESLNQNSNGGSFIFTSVKDDRVKKVSSFHISQYSDKTDGNLIGMIIYDCNDICKFDVNGQPIVEGYIYFRTPESISHFKGSSHHERLFYSLFGREWKECRETMTVSGFSRQDGQWKNASTTFNSNSGDNYTDSTTNNARYMKKYEFDIIRETMENFLNPNLNKTSTQSSDMVVDSSNFFITAGRKLVALSKKIEIPSMISSAHAMSNSAIDSSATLQSNTEYVVAASIEELSSSNRTKTTPLIKHVNEAAKSLVQEAIVHRIEHSVKGLGSKYIGPKLAFVEGAIAGEEYREQSIREGISPGEALACAGVAAGTKTVARVVGYSGLSATMIGATSGTGGLGLLGAATLWGTGAAVVETGGNLSGEVARQGCHAVVKALRKF